MWPRSKPRWAGAKSSKGRLQCPTLNNKVDQLLARLEKDIDVTAQMHVVALSIAVSLKRIADHFENERTSGVPSKRR